MFGFQYDKKFLKDVKLSQKRGKDLQKLKQIMSMLVEHKQLPQKNRTHKLQSRYKDCWECHIEPDWLLVYEKLADSTIFFLRTGTHSDLFD